MALRAGFHGTVGQPSAQIIDGSLKFDQSNKTYLKKTPGSAGNRRTWTYSAWIKRGDLASSERGLFSTFGSSHPTTALKFGSDQTLEFLDYQGGYICQKITSQLFRDTGWYHIVIAIDTTLTTAEDRFKLYVNGERVTSFGTSTNISTQNQELDWNSATEHNLFMHGNEDTPYDGMGGQTYFIDGQALTPDSFGFTDPLTGTWRPKKFIPQATPNSGVTWSSGAGSNFESARPASNGFNGDPETFTRTDNANVTATVTLPSSVPFTTLQVRGARDSGNGTITVNGVDVSSQFTSSSATLETVTITGVTSPLTSIALTGISGSAQPRFSQIIVDGVTLIDGDTANMGRNGFYLPLDGNSPIGQDKSRNGNDWTPVHFGGSVALDNPQVSGALPILNTTQGGTQAGVGVRTDPFHANLVLALPLVGSNADVSNSINSTSTTKVMTNVGNAAASSDTSNFYKGSFEFDGSGDGITCPDNTDFEFGSGDFTVECWVKQDDTSSFDVFVGKYGGSSDGEFILGKNGNTPTFYWQDSSGNANINATNFRGNTDSWYHIAGVREGNVFTLYVNGICENSTTDSTTIKTTSNKLTIGFENDQSGSPFDGYLQDVRIYKGVAKYSGTTVGTQYFIPPSTSPDILPDTPSGVSGSSKLTKITDGAVSFDGTDYLTVPDGSNDFSFGTGAYTVEGYLYPTTLTGNGDANPRFFCCGTPDSSSNRNQLQIVITASGQIRLDTNSTTYSSTAGDVSANKWQHIAVARDGSGNLKAFVDGRQVLTQTSVNNDITNNDGISLGIEAGYTSRFTGFMSNVRILKGTALYTSNFTPPSAPLTNITNTKLLCCQSPTSVESSAVGPITSDFYSAGVYLTATTYTDRGGSSCTVTNNGSITSSSAGTNSFGLTTAADVTGQQRIDINMGNVSGSFFQSAWTLEMFFKKDASEDNWFVGTSTSGASYTTGWSIDAQGGTIRWNYDNQGGVPPKDTGIAIGNDTWYFMRVQRTPSTSQSRFYIEVYDSPTNRIGSFEGTAQDGASHSNNILKIGDANGNSNNLSANFQFANVMITAGTRRNQTVPTLSSGQRVLNATIDSLVVPIGDAAATTFNPFNTDINTARGQETGYVTWNPLQNSNLKDGNLVTAGTGNFYSTIVIPKTGRWYWETIASSASYIGIDNRGQGGTKYIHYNPDGQYQYTGGSTSSYGSSFTTGDVIGVAFNASNMTIRWYKNNLDQGEVNVGSGGVVDLTDLDLQCQLYTDSSNEIFTNWGQKPFKFSPPDGFQPLNFANTRPETVFARPDQFVGVATYTGNGSTQSISGLKFGAKPDFVWIKQRSSPSQNHALFDSIRGPGHNLSSSTVHAERSDHSGATGDLRSFDVNGFSLGSSAASGARPVNLSGKDIVAWCWKAGGNKGVFNVDDVGYASASDAGLTGTNHATLIGASIGTKQGFSIIRYQGGGNNVTTVSHGLLQAPQFMIIKNIDDADDWTCYHEGIGNSKYLTLNDNTAASDGTMFNDTTPTSTVFTLGAAPGSDYHNRANRSGYDYIAYVWHDVPGLQKFGTYEGNGSTDGPFVECGFKPALIIIKQSNGGNNWFLIDTTREPTNPAGRKWLLVDTNDQEITDNNKDFDILSNGFKPRLVTGYHNDNGVPYVYMAWAEAPTVNLFGGQSNAR